MLANEDVLQAGEYPVRVQLVGPENAIVYDTVITATVPDPKTEPPFALKVFSEDVVIDGPAGVYRFLINFQKQEA